MRRIRTTPKTSNNPICSFKVDFYLSETTLARALHFNYRSVVKDEDWYIIKTYDSGIELAYDVEEGYKLYWSNGFNVFKRKQKYKTRKEGIIAINELTDLLSDLRSKMRPIHFKELINTPGMYPVMFNIEDNKCDDTLVRKMLPKLGFTPNKDFNSTWNLTQPEDLVLWNG